MSTPLIITTILITIIAILVELYHAAPDHVEESGCKVVISGGDFVRKVERGKSQARNTQSGAACPSREDKNGCPTEAAMTARRAGTTQLRLSRSGSLSPGSVKNHRRLGRASPGMS